MIVLIVIVCFSAVVVLLSRQQRVRANSCCGTRQWPPVDLMGPDETSNT